MAKDPDFRGYTFNLPLEEQSLADSLINQAAYVGCKLSTDVRVPGRKCLVIPNIFILER